MTEGNNDGFKPASTNPAPATENSLKIGPDSYAHATGVVTNAQGNVQRYELPMHPVTANALNQRGTQTSEKVGPPNTLNIGEDRFVNANGNMFNARGELIRYELPLGPELAAMLKPASAEFTQKLPELKQSLGGFLNPEELAEITSPEAFEQKFQKKALELFTRVGYRMPEAKKDA